MSKFEFAKTQVPDNYVKALNTKGFLFGASYADMIAKVSLAAVGDILREIKSLDKPAAFVFRDSVGQPIVSAIVKHIPSDDPEHSEGNWSYVWSFDPADITDDMLVADILNESNQRAFVVRSGELYGIEYLDGSLVSVITLLFQVLKEWLTANAKEGEETEIELKDVFLARSIIEDGEVILSFEPLGKMVQLIKSDVDLQQN